jgi:hypothetical protein
MSKTYGISDTTISLGMQELEDNGIIEITRDHLTLPDFSDRKANACPVKRYFCINFNGVYKMMPWDGS